MPEFLPSPSEVIPFFSNNSLGLSIAVFLGDVLWHWSSACDLINVVSSVVESKKVSSFDL